MSTYAAPAITTAAAPVITSSPQVIMSSPVISAPATTTIMSSGRNLLAMGNVISERVVSIEELASAGRYEATQPTQVQIAQGPYGAVEYVTAAPAVVEQAVYGVQQAVMDPNYPPYGLSDR